MNPSLVVTDIPIREVSAIPIKVHDVIADVMLLLETVHSRQVAKVFTPVSRLQLGMVVANVADAQLFRHRRVIGDVDHNGIVVTPATRLDAW